MQKLRTKNLNNSYLLLLFIVLEGLVFSFANPHFLTLRNALNILDMIAVDLFVAIGLTFVISTGNIDLSVGSVIALSGMACAFCLKATENLVLAIFIALAVGLLFGFINGLIITKTKINAFIGTLSTMAIFRGLAVVLSDGKPIYGFDRSLSHLFQFRWNGISLTVILSFLLLCIAYVVAHHRPWGLYLQMQGANAKSLFRAGIDENRVLRKVFCFSSLLAAMAGILITAQLNTAEPLAGVGYEMNAIAATVLGGTYINGGNNKILGTALACLALGILANGLVMLSISSKYQQLISGMILLAAMVLTDKNKK